MPWHHLECIHMFLAGTWLAQGCVIRAQSRARAAFLQSSCVPSSVTGEAQALAGSWAALQFCACESFYGSGQSCVFKTCNNEILSFF